MLPPSLPPFSTRDLVNRLCLIQCHCPWDDVAMGGVAMGGVITSEMREIFHCPLNVNKRGYVCDPTSAGSSPEHDKHEEYHTTQFLVCSSFDV